MKINRILILITIFILIVVIFHNILPKKRDFYSTHYYLFSGKRIYLGMTKEEIESELGPLTDYTDDYQIILFGNEENILYKNKLLKVKNSFMMEDNQLVFHEYVILTDEITAKAIIADYSKILIKLNNIHLKRNGELFDFYGKSEKTSNSENREFYARTNYKPPYLTIVFN